MGFEINFINKVLTFYQVNSLEMAIEYMTKINGVWNHPFVNVDDNLNDCLVCGERADEHRINFFKKSLSFNNPANNNNNNQELSLNRLRSAPIINLPINEEQPIMKEEEIKIKVNNEICRICLSPIEDEFNYKCSHKYCKECILEYILNKINSSDVEEIYCPEGKNVCNNLLEDELIRSLISGRDLERYEKFNRRAKIFKIPNAILCPIPDCDSYAIVDKNIIGNNFSTCVGNNHMFCSKCNQIAHPGILCDFKLESEFKKWVGKEKVKKCPKCGFFIQKNEGCNHMTCGNSSCKYEFCWICMGKYSSSHFNNILSPCYGLQNVNQRNVLVRHPCLRYFYKIGIILLILILFTLAVTFASAVLIIIFYQSIRAHQNVIYNLYGKTRDFMKIIYILFLICGWIAMIPLGYILLALFIGTLPITLTVLLIRCIVK